MVKNKKTQKDMFEYSILMIVGIVLFVAILSISTKTNAPVQQKISGEASSKQEAFSSNEQDNEKALDSNKGINDCFDSDDGFYIDRKGRVYGFEEGNLFDFTDKCVDSDVLNEYVCVGEGYNSDQVRCDRFGYSRCLDGSCI